MNQIIARIFPPMVLIYAGAIATTMSVFIYIGWEGRQRQVLAQDSGFTLGVPQMALIAGAIGLIVFILGVILHVHRRRIDRNSEPVDIDEYEDDEA